MLEPAPSDAPPERPPAPGEISPGVLGAGLLFGVFATFLAVGAPAQLLNLAWGLWFGEIFVFLGVTWITLRLAGRDPLRTTGLTSLTLGGALTGFAAGLINYVAWAVPLMALAEEIFPERLVELFDSSSIFKVQTTPELVLIIAGVSLAAPFCEEFLFRGVVQPGLSRWLDPPRAIVVTALAFSAFHLDPVGFGARFELGILFGLLAWRSGSLWPGIFAHAANNLISTAAWFATNGADEAELPWWVPVVMCVVGNLMLAALVVVARRTGSLRVAQVAEETPAPRPAVLVTVAPWLLGALASALLLVTVDPRGVVLNVYDQIYPAKAPRKTASAAERAAWEDLRALRVRARGGEVPLDDYLRLRRLAADDAGRSRDEPKSPSP